MDFLEPRVGAHYKMDGQIYEIITINEGIISMCSLIHKYRRSLETNAFTSLMMKGHLTLHQRTESEISPAAVLKSLSAAHRVALDRKMEYVNPALSELGGRLPRKQTLQLITRVKKRINDPHPPKPGTLRAWLRRYLENECNPLALTRLQRARRARLSAEAQQLMDHYLDTTYLTRIRPSLTHAYRLMRGQIAEDNKERLKIGALPLTPPSYSTFRRRLLKRDRYSVVAQREGEKAARLLLRSSGHLHMEEDPYSWVIFDSHLMHVFVVDERNQRKGRPTLSTVLVPSTRYCIGWDISIGAPSAEKMLNAVIRAIVNNGKPAGITNDHGSEVLNTWSLTFFSELGMNPDYVPVGDADAKAIKERFYGTVCTGFSHNLKGTTKSNPAQRGHYNAADYACLTIEQLRSGFAMWLEAYHVSVHSALQTTPARRAEELKAVALPPERYTEEELRQHSYGVWRSRLNSGRVNKHNLSWYGPRLPDIRQRLKRNQQAIVYYNPCDLGTVWVAHPDEPTDWSPAIATRPDYQNHLMLGDHLKITQQFNAESKKFDIDEACIKLYKLAQWLEDCYTKNQKENSKNNSQPTETSQRSYAPSYKADAKPDFETHKLRRANTQAIEVCNDTGSDREA